MAIVLFCITYPLAEPHAEFGAAAGYLITSAWAVGCAAVALSVDWLIEHRHRPR
ncbi:hypothetical protein AB0A77_02705 [Streptomyces varsoviensis]|uniref:hypothetical protein n=1 Tax=Streptomyces varsoviensis TaxID=67373 RepID=UPI0033F33DB5